MAAWRLRDAGYDVTVFEKAPVMGGAAATYRHPDAPHKPYDLAFRFWVPVYYPHFESMLRMLNESEEVIHLGNALLNFVHPEVGPVGSNHSGLFNMSEVPGRSLQEDLTAPWAKEVARMWDLVNLAHDTYGEKQWMTEPTIEFMQKHNFTRDFIIRHIFVCINTFVASGDSSLQMPIGAFYAADMMWPICSGRGRATMKTKRNGMDSYMNKVTGMLSSLGVKLRVNAPVDQVLPSASGDSVRVLLENAEQHEFDHVIIAAHLPIAGHIERATTDPLKRDLLGLLGPGSMGYVAYGQRSTLVHTHSMALEPLQRTVLNNGSVCWKREHYHLHTFDDVYMFGNCFQHRDTAYGDACVTGDGDNATAVWVGDKTTADFFIPQEKRLFNREFPLPSHNPNFMRVGRNLHKIQGKDRIWYTGVDVSSLNYHEAALVSGLAVARELGGTYPFPDSPHASHVFRMFQQWIMWGVNYYASPMAAQ